MTLADKVQQFNTDADLVHAVVHGPNNATVATEGGAVPTLAKLTKDAQDEFNASQADLYQARDEAVTAASEATSARDVTMAAGSLRSTIAQGLAATVNGQFFAVKQANGDAVDVYLNSAGVAVYQDTRPFASGESKYQATVLERSAKVVTPLPPAPIVDIAPVEALFKNRAFIPNRRATPSENLYLWRTGEITAAAATGGITVTKRFANGPQGQQTAARLQFTSNTGIWQLFNASRPAGSYTIKFKAKSNAGAGSQTFRYGLFNTGLSSVTVDEAGWTTVTYTFTTNGADHANFSIYSAAVFVALDLLVDEFQFYPAEKTIPTFASEPDDVGTLQAAPFRAGGAVGITGAVQDSPLNGYIKLDREFDARNFTELTAFVLVKEDALPGNVFAAVLMAPDQDGTTYNTFAIGTEMPSGVESYVQVRTPQRSVAAVAKTSMIIRGEGWHIIGARINAAKASAFFHELEFYTQAGAWAGMTARWFRAGGGGFGGNQPFNGKIGRYVVYDRALSDAECYDVVANLRESLALYGEAITLRSIYIAEGDSITADTALASYAYRQRDLFNPTLKVKNFAVGGNKLADLVARQADVVKAITEATKGGRRCIVSVLVGANDTVAIADPATYTTSLFAYYDALRAAGAKLVASTLLPNTLVNFNARRGAVNTLIRAAANRYDALCDFAADPTMGPDAAASNAALYPDGLHPSATGQANLATIMQARIAALLA